MIFRFHNFGFLRPAGMAVRNSIDILKMVQDAFAHYELFIHYCGYFR